MTRDNNFMVDLYYGEFYDKKGVDKMVDTWYAISHDNKEIEKESEYYQQVMEEYENTK